MVNKLTTVYINDIWHEYNQEYIPLAYDNTNLSSQVSQCAILNVIIIANFHLKKSLMLTNNIILAISNRDNFETSMHPV